MNGLEVMLSHNALSSQEGEAEPPFSMWKFSINFTVVNGSHYYYVFIILLFII